MTKETFESVKERVKNFNDEQLDNLSEWWLDFAFKANIVESEGDFENRKSIVLPLIIEEKLNRYESTADSTD